MFCTIHFEHHYYSILIWYYCVGWNSWCGAVYLGEFLKLQVLQTFVAKHELIDIVLVAGAYDEEEAAARVYDLAAIKYWGASTYTNFPV